MSHDSILFFTEDGVARSLKAYQIPEASRTAVGAAITQVPPALPFDRVSRSPSGNGHLSVMPVIMRQLALASRCCQSDVQTSSLLC